MLDILVVSPVPSHPQDQGNSARIQAMTQGLRSMGARIDFVYVALEGVDAARCLAMQNAWDRFGFVLPKGKQQRSRAECFALDDWYEPDLDELLVEKFRAQSYDMMIVNYVWFSRAFETAPSDCLKVLDTHDVFGGRHNRLIQDGIKPAWFYTTPTEEGRGLDRADLIVAIQEEEAEVLRLRTERPVSVIGHLLSEAFLPDRPRDQRLRVGYLASGNPSNVYSLEQICSALKHRPDVAERFEFRLSGSICDTYKGDVRPFRRIGRVKRVEDAYREVDISLNPNMSGSGLKIKTVEALAYGRPLLATIGAMVGIETDAPEHLCETLDVLVDRLGKIQSLSDLSERSRSTFMRYQRTQCLALGELYDQGTPIWRQDAAQGARAA